MQIASAEELVQKRCLPCEGGVEPSSNDQITEQLHHLPGWQHFSDSRSIRRTVRCKNFVQAVACINAIAELAETEAHHPDLHLTGYRSLTIELTTHAIRGLSENDFILAAKIDRMLGHSFPSLGTPQ